MSIDLDAAVTMVEEQATMLHSLLRYATRAFVIEFAGTPKSGKSTSVEATRHFFVRHGFRVHVLSERASLCPIPMKGHLFFNTWCATSMLAELLANIETETDIVIVDRGLFDALAWMTLQSQRGELTADEVNTIESFLLLERWRTLVDLVVAMNVTPEEAISRENSQRVSPKPGSIMNVEVLGAIADSVHIAADRYAPLFGGILVHDTTGQQVRASNVRLVGQVLERLEAFVNPDVLVVPRATIEALPLSDGGFFGEEALDAALDCVSTHGRFVPRAEAEVAPGLVQIIPCGVLSHEGGVFLFQRKENDPKYHLYGNSSIWQGCHVTQTGEEDACLLLERNLLDRVSRSLYLSRRFPIRGLGYCWDRDDPQSSRHFGVVYEIQIDNALAAADLKKKEFRKQRGHGYYGRFDDWEALRVGTANLNLESWSRAILAGIDRPSATV